MNDDDGRSGSNWTGSPSDAEDDETLQAKLRGNLESNKVPGLTSLGVAYVGRGTGGGSGVFLNGRGNTEVTSGESTPVSSVRILDVNILICLKAVVRQCEGNGTRRKIITPAPDVADFEGKSGTAKHVE